MSTRGDTIFWGEMHTHTYCGDVVFGSFEEALKIARTHLDFWAPAEHNSREGFPKKKFLSDYGKMRSLIATHNTPHKFVTFMGFECSGFRESGHGHGDYNIYFKDEGPERCFQYSSSNAEHLSVDDFPSFVAFAKENRGIMIPHHCGYKVARMQCGTNWNDFDPEIMPLAEIFSMHGSSETDEGPFPMDLYWMGPRESAGTIRTALEQGIKIGFIASSDNHAGYPGCYKMGLIGCYASKLTRKSLWEALLKRRTYAVTGDRIKVDFKINGQRMGSEISSNKREIYTFVSGEDRIDKIDIIKNGKLWRRETCAFEENTLTPRMKLRIEWGWGGGSIQRWDGHLEVVNGKLVNYNPNFGPPAPNYVTTFNGKECQWVSHTVGSLSENSGELKPEGKWHYARNGREGTNQIVFEIEGSEKTEIFIVMNDNKYHYNIVELLENSHVEPVQNIALKEVWPYQHQPPKIKIYRAISQNLYQKESYCIDTKVERAIDYYYLRVTQTNGQMAWSSPIWVNSPK